MVGAVLRRIPFFWILLLLSSLLLSVSVASVDFSHCGGCDDADDTSLWSTDNILQCQKVGDFLIAAAYFSIPLELLYFATCSDLFPLKWIVLQFGAFIVLCGLTHLITVFTYEPHSFHLVLALTVAKFLTALVSFATAITLLTLIPQLLRVKVRENFLIIKARELDREVGMMKRQEEASWHVRMLTHEIRKSLDRHTILYTTMVQLSKTLELQNCAVWMPDESRSEMVLTHQLRERDIMEAHNRSLPVDDPDVAEIKATKDAKVLGPESALGVASQSKLESGPVAAIRMPMLRVSNFKGGTPEVMETSYAILVLVLPNDGLLGWGPRELEIVEVVADQVAVALSHAALLEESQLMREKLAEQHRDLLRAKHEALMAAEARNSFQTAMYDGMRRPMHSILGLVSMMQQESMNPEQRLVMDAIVRTTSVASTLMNDVMQTSTMNREHLSLVRRPFNLHSFIKEAVGVVRCLTGSKGVDFEFQVDNSLPERIVGDEKRVFHIVLHMVGTLINRCNAGCLSLYVNSYNEVEEMHNQDWMLRRANFSGGYVCVKFEIRIRKSKDILLSSSSGQITEISQGLKPNNLEMGLSFNMCKKIVQMMNGNIWSVSDSKSRETIMLAIQFQLQPATPVSGASSDLYRSSPIHNFTGLRVFLVDSDDTNRVVTHKLLEKLGCRVLSVASGIQCMGSFASAESSFQLVILDLAMQTMDGFEVARTIRKFRSNSWLPLIVALAARTDDNIRDRCSRSGINGLIQKPVTLAALGDELYRVLQNN
ncbi:ethylene receptor 2-like [Phragmites australis]|uniref:ethylene receptor 2-like n=1 Tax=Phragmites australis TaxID=29695 RepID=UPI002D76C5A2|nr:ethylene receptor 2-like [Phragmites australis]